MIVGSDTSCSLKRLAKAKSRIATFEFALQSSEKVEARRIFPPIRELKLKAEPHGIQADLVGEQSTFILGCEVILSYQGISRSQSYGVLPACWRRVCILESGVKVRSCPIRLG